MRSKKNVLQNVKTAESRTKIWPVRYLFDHTRGPGCFRGKLVIFITNFVMGGGYCFLSRNFNDICVFSFPKHRFYLNKQRRLSA